MSNTNWLIIAKSQDLVEIELQKAYLDNNHIQTVLVNHQDSVYHIGEYELLVQEHNLSLAQELLNISYK